MDKQEIDENALLWLAFVDGRVASSVFTREGKYFKRWFVGLNPEDLVVFRLSTRPELRGRGLAPSLIVHALHCTSPKGCAYIDCRTYNKPSIRCIEKVGFECIATKKTIKREWALYD
jgi:GNAT superfamily N-acetyltransferase